MVTLLIYPRNMGEIVDSWQPLGPLLKVKLLVGYIFACRACCTVTDRRTGVRPAQIGVKKDERLVCWDLVGYM